MWKGVKGIDREEGFLREKIFKSNPEKRKGYVLYFIPELCETPSSSKREVVTTQIDSSRMLLIERRQEHWDVKITKKKNESVKKRLVEALMYGRKC